MMDRDMVGRQLDDLPSGDSVDIDKDTLGMLFPPGETAGVIDSRTRSAANSPKTTTADFYLTISRRSSRFQNCRVDGTN